MISSMALLLLAEEASSMVTNSKTSKKVIENRYPRGQKTLHSSKSSCETIAFVCFCFLDEKLHVFSQLCFGQNLLLYQ
jgi:hypothetical protein